MDGDIQELEERVRVLEVSAAVWKLALAATIAASPNKFEIYGLFQTFWSTAKEQIRLNENDDDALNHALSAVSIALNEEIV